VVGPSLEKAHLAGKKNTKNAANFVVENVKTQRSCKNNISWGHNPKCLDMWGFSITLESKEHQFGGVAANFVVKLSAYISLPR